MRCHGVVGAFALAASALQLRDLPGLGLSGSGLLDEHEHHTVSRHEYVEKLLHDKRQKEKDGLSIRLLPLGASIMSGAGASDGAGLRKQLRDALLFEGFKVDMVGSLQSGQMADNDHAGVGGDIIDQVGKRVADVVTLQPNVVIINVGTNDASQSIDISRAGDRIRNVLEDLWKGEGMDKTCIMLSTLLPIGKEDGEKARKEINEQYRLVVKDLSGEGKCIFLADMDPSNGEGAGWISLNDDMDKDGIHPNDIGHKKMASIFFNAIMRARSRIVNVDLGETSGSPGPSTESCDKKFGDGTGAGGLTQTGAGEDDGVYVHEAIAMEVDLTLESDEDRDQWRFARLFSRDYDDLLERVESESDEQQYRVWKNSADGKGGFESIGNLNPDLACELAGVHFVDMTGDGLDDLVCVSENGEVLLSVNQGDGSNGKAPSFKRVSDDAVIYTQEGASQSRVRIADVDGDGRGDFLLISDNGDIEAWRNGGTSVIPEYWQSLGVICSVKDQADIDGVRFEDLNGDGRDDWLQVNDIGAVTTWTNSRSCESGKIGDGLHITWREAVHGKDSKGHSHLGMEKLLDADDKDVQNRIHFARVIGRSQGVGLLGRQDYVFMDHEELENGKHQYTVRVWRNEGQGGTTTKADGNRYCNMMGHEDGKMDFVWITSGGKMTLYPNAGKKDVSDGSSFWEDAVDSIWTPTESVDRKFLHLTDYDGDGACDIVYTDPQNKNRIAGVWLNKFPSSGKWQWDFLDAPTEASEIQCSYAPGIGPFDTAVRFADITGNNRGDYLCMEVDGRVTAFTHEKDGSWKWLDQIKFKEDLDRANFRWADVNGDGKADLIWADKFNGNARVWYNEGPGSKSDNGGSVMHWRKVDDPVYDGNVAGACTYFADLDGNGRADMHAVSDAFTNEAETWFSPDCGSSGSRGGDSDKVEDPKLPVQPGAPSIEAGGLSAPEDTDKDGPKDDNMDDDKDLKNDETEPSEDKQERETTKKETTEGQKPVETGSPKESNDVFIDPSVWEEGELHFQEPAVIVLPPVILHKPSTVTMPPYTTSIQVGSEMTTVTITLKPLTLTEVPMANLALNSMADNGTIIQPVPSVNLSPVEVEVGSTVTNVTVPPWPWVTMGPPESWTTDPEPPGPEAQTTEPQEKLEETSTRADEEAEETSTTDIAIVPVPAGGGEKTGPPPDGKTTAASADARGTQTSNLPTGKFASEHFSTTSPPPVEMSPDPPGEFETKTDSQWDWHKYPTRIEPVDETDDEKKKYDDGPDIVFIPCKVWFINWCPEINGVKIKHWRMNFPVGIIGPGPPPPMQFPPGFNSKGPMPPWPKITNPPGPGPKTPEFPENPEEPTDCETSTASICSTTTSFSIEPEGTTTKTITSEVSESCESIVGCWVTDFGEEFTTEDGSCTIKPEDRRRWEPVSVATTSTWSHVRRDQRATDVTSHSTKPSSQSPNNAKYPQRHEDNTHVKRAGDIPKGWEDDHLLFKDGCEKKNMVLLPAGFRPTPKVIQRLEAVAGKVQMEHPNFRWTHIVSTEGATTGRTVYIYIYDMPKALAQRFSRMAEVGTVYDSMYSRKSYPMLEKRSAEYLSESVQGEGLKQSKTGGHKEVMKDSKAPLTKRLLDIYGHFFPNEDWTLSMISAYKSIPNWLTDPLYTVVQGVNRFWYHRYDLSTAGGPGAGQFVYLIDSCITPNHEEFAARSEFNAEPAWRGTTFLADYEVEDHGIPYDSSCTHGTGVLSKIVGRTLGHAPEAAVIRVNSKMPVEGQESLREFDLEALVLVLDDMQRRGSEVVGRAVVNMSWESPAIPAPPAFRRVFTEILSYIAEHYKAVLVTAAGNGALKNRIIDNRLPGALKTTKNEYLRTMLVVGSVNMAGKRFAGSQVFSAKDGRDTLDLMVHAPGRYVKVAAPHSGYHLQATGTSFAAPLVSGMIAYWRALDSPRFKEKLKDPAMVEDAVRKFSRTLNIDFADTPFTQDPKGPGVGTVPVVWNGNSILYVKLDDGQVVHFDQSCLMYNNLPEGICPDDWNAGEAPPGFANPLAPPNGGGGNQDSMDIDEGPSNPPNVAGLWPQALTMSRGAPSPTCSPGFGEVVCGSRCTGEDCESRPGHPPAFNDSVNGGKDGEVEKEKAEEEAKMADAKKKADEKKEEDEKKKKEEDDKKTKEAGKQEKDAACKRCRRELGDTYCPANSFWESCVLGQCKGLKDCHTCGLDCQKEVSGLKNPNDDTDPNGPSCKKCNDNMKATKCAPKGFETCVKDQCIKDEACGRCKMDCQKRAGDLEPPYECEKPKPQGLFGSLDDVFDCVNKGPEWRGGKKEEPKEKPKEKPKEEPSHKVEPVDGGKGSTIMRRRRKQFRRAVLA